MLKPMGDQTASCGTLDGHSVDGIAKYKSDSCPDELPLRERAPAHEQTKTEILELSRK